MKKILFCVFAFLLAGVGFAEVDVSANVSYQAIYDATVEVKKFRGQDVSDLSGNILKLGELGGNVSVTYFFESKDSTSKDALGVLYGDKKVEKQLESFQVGIYGSFDYKYQYTGEIRLDNVKFDQEVTGQDFFLVLGMDARFNFARYVYSDVLVGLAGFYNGFEAENEKYSCSILGLGVEFGGDIGFRLINTSRFCTALSLGAKLELGVAAGTIDEGLYKKKTDFTATNLFAVDVFSGITVMFN